MNSYYENLLKLLVSGFIEHPGDLRVNDQGVPGHSVRAITISTHLADMPKVIGSMGKTVNALKILVAFAAKKRNETVDFTVLEPHIGRKAPEPPFQANEAWDNFDNRRIQKKIKEICDQVCDGEILIHFNNAPDKSRTFFDICGRIHDDLKGALQTVIYAIGKSNKRMLSVQFKDGSKIPTTGNPL